MRTILITGGIGSGKSEACRYLAGKGYPVYDSDSRTKRLYETVPGLVGKVEEAIGVPFSEVRIIFTDTVKRHRLEDVVYPEVKKDMLAWKLENKDADLLFIESAIALQKPMFNDVYDIAVEIEAPLEMRLARNANTISRLASQIDPECRSVDYRITNDGTIEQLHYNIDSLLKLI